VSDADVKRAYHLLAKRFHPDRFRKSVDDNLHARIEAAFAKIAQAYETLKDKRARAVYDSKLLQHGQAERASDTTGASSHSVADLTKPATAANFKPSDSAPRSEVFKESASAHPEERFQQGLSALRSGNNTLAITSLGEAARLQPTQARYRAYYGRALANDERLRRSAEAELKAAIMLDANNSSYRVMLAELYIEIGLARRAQSELISALSIDPRNEDARKLMDKIKR
jgi:curved DNA-binding protein CbpA